MTTASHSMQPPHRGNVPQAAAGEILVSPEATAQAGDLLDGTQKRLLALKGIDMPVSARVLFKA